MSTPRAGGCSSRRRFFSHSPNASCYASSSCDHLGCKRHIPLPIETRVSNQKLPLDTQATALYSGCAHLENLRPSPLAASHSAVHHLLLERTPPDSKSRGGLRDSSGGHRSVPFATVACDPPRQRAKTQRAPNACLLLNGRMNEPIPPASNEQLPAGNEQLLARNKPLFARNEQLPARDEQLLARRKNFPREMNIFPPETNNFPPEVNDFPPATNNFLPEMKNFPSEINNFPPETAKNV